jgi:tRNA 2-thiocytidine biosynthesis protein TtcA
MLNLVFAGQLGAMPPRLVADEGRLIVVRPLVYCAEEDIRVFAQLAGFPILPCDLCGSQENLQRKAMARLLDDLERQHPGTKTIMSSALQNVRPSQLLDKRLWSSLGLAAAIDEGEGAAAEPIAPQRLLRG